MVNRNDWNEMTENEKQDYWKLVASAEYEALSQVGKIKAEAKISAPAHLRNWKRQDETVLSPAAQANERVAQRLIAQDAAATRCGCGALAGTCDGNSAFCS